LFEISSRILERQYQPETSSWRKFLTRKKFLREKTMIKNFFNALVELITTISPSKAQSK